MTLEGNTDGEYCLILSEDQFLEVATKARLRRIPLMQILSMFPKVLIYPFSGTAQGTRALSELVGGICETSRPRNGANFYVRGPRKMCGPFCDLQCGGPNPFTDSELHVENSGYKIDTIVSIGNGGLMTRIELSGIDLYVVSTTAVFDVTAIHRQNLNASEIFSSLVPLLFFLRHCEIPLPQTSLQWANWIIDDPNLKPEYGFLNLRQLEKSVRSTNSAVTIAFIPWNHRRTSEKGASVASEK